MKEALFNGIISSRSPVNLSMAAAMFDRIQLPAPLSIDNVRESPLVYLEN